jgi:RNA polymerase sigma-70 factor (ECF subfamily)
MAIAEAGDDFRPLGNSLGAIRDLSLSRPKPRSNLDTVLDSTARTDEELAAEAVREGSDGLAFQALVDRYRRRVWQICYRLLGNEHDANDAAQEVFVRMFFHRAKFAGRSKFSTWVHGIAVRVCLTYRRGRGRRQRHEQVAPEGTLENHADRTRVAEERGAAMDVYAMLDQLNEEDRAMLILKYAEGYTFEELADIFDMTVSACKMRVSRARDKLQSKFGARETSTTT